MTCNEIFGPEYVRPSNPACPACECCTAVLCERGRACVTECSGAAGAADAERVRGCPCSAESTRGTLAWRAGLVRAVTFATEKPLRPELEQLLRFVYEHEPYGDLVALMPKLRMRRYVRWEPGEEARITDFGRAYVIASEGQRMTSPVTVRSVDVRARTAEVIVSVYSTEEPVTVPMDQVVNSHTGLTVETATSAALYAEMNPNAHAPDYVVLTKVTSRALADADMAGCL